MMPDIGRADPIEVAARPPIDAAGRNLHAVAEMIPLIAWTAGPDGRADFFNRRWHDYTGMGHAASAGLGWMAAVDPADLPAVRSRWREARSAGAAYEAEHGLRGSDGTWRRFAARAEPLRDEGGRIVGWFGTCTAVEGRGPRGDDGDVELLRASEARFRAIATATAAIVWSTDAEGRPIDGARSWGEFTGQSLAEYCGRGWLDVVHPDDRHHASASWAAALYEGRPYEYELRLRRRDGVYRRLFERGVPVLGPDGSVREWVGTCVDVTEAPRRRGHAPRRRGPAQEARRFRRHRHQLRLDPRRDLPGERRLSPDGRLRPRRVRIGPDRLEGSHAAGVARGRRARDRRGAGAWLMHAL